MTEHTARPTSGTMQYELDPDSLRVLEHREHKKASDQPPLFNSEGLTA